MTARQMIVRISRDAMEQLEALRIRSGGLEGRNGEGLTNTVEWLIRAMTDHYARIDREKEREEKARGSAR